MMTTHLINQLEDTQFIEQSFYAAWVTLQEYFLYKPICDS